MIMASQFESLWQPFIIMFTIPLSVIGVVAILLFTNTPLNIMVLLGFIVLGGIVVNNGIVLIDYINILRRQGLSAYDAVIKSSQARLRPILMTAFTTVFGLTPLALGLTEGSGLQQSMAMRLEQVLTWLLRAISGLRQKMQKWMNFLSEWGSLHSLESTFCQG